MGAGLTMRVIPRGLSRLRVLDFQPQFIRWPRSSYQSGARARGSGAEAKGLGIAKAIVQPTHAVIRRSSSASRSPSRYPAANLEPPWHP